MSTDSVADFITRLKNAAMAGHTRVEVPYSKFLHAIADALRREGYIASVEKEGRKARKHLEVTLAYDSNGKACIHGARRVSKPGRRVYTPAADTNSFDTQTEQLVLTTPKGIMTHEKARAEHVGGEALFTIW